MLQHPLTESEVNPDHPSEQDGMSCLLPLAEEFSIAVHALQDAYPLGEYDCGSYFGADFSADQLSNVKRIICSRLSQSGFSGVLKGITFMSCSLDEVDFTRADLAGVLFLGPKLENLDKGINTDTPWPSYRKILWPAQLESVLFQEIHAPQGLDFSGGEPEQPRVIRRVRLLDCRAPQSDFRDVVLEDVCFAGSSLTRSVFDRAVVSGELQQVNLSQSSLRGVKFAADLSEADLSACDLAGADLTASILTKANLSLTDLRDVRLPRDLRKTQMFAVNLTDVDLSDKDLRGASLSYVEGLRVDLLPSDLSGMHFEGIDLTQVDLVSRQERGLLTGTVFENCGLPENFYQNSSPDLESVNEGQLDQQKVVKECVGPPDSIRRIASVPLHLEVANDLEQCEQSLKDLKRRICDSLFALVDQEMMLYSLHRQILSSPYHTHQIHLVRVNEDIILGRTVDPEIRERGRFRQLCFRAERTSGEMFTSKVIYVPHRSEMLEGLEIEATLYEQLALDINRVYTLYGVIPGTKGHVLWKKDLITGEREVAPVAEILDRDDSQGVVILQLLRGISSRR